MSKNKSVRFFDVNEVQDKIDTSAVWVNMGVPFSEPRFLAVKSEDLGTKSGKFMPYSFTYNYSANSICVFPGDFTFALWAKFPKKAITDEVYGNKFVFMLTNTETISVDIPNTVTVEDWNHYSICRTGSDIVARINGDTVGTLTSSNEANFLSDKGAYIYLGNQNKYSTGYDVIADDILLANVALWQEDFNIETLDYYTDVSVLKFKFLYISSATGYVYGYGEE